MGFPDFDIPDPITAPASGRNMLRDGAIKLADWMICNASEAIVYVTVAGAVDCRAVLGKKLLKLDDGQGGFQIQWTDMDFLIRANDLKIGDAAVTPVIGDIIHLVISGGIEVQTFEVCQFGGEPHWRWSDQYQYMRRIHAKFTETEPYS